MDALPVLSWMNNVPPGVPKIHQKTFNFIQQVMRNLGRGGVTPKIKKKTDSKCRLDCSGIM